MRINETEVQLSHDETAVVSMLHGHIHFHGAEHAQRCADKWVDEAKDDDAKARREKATCALGLVVLTAQEKAWCRGASDEPLIYHPA